MEDLICLLATVRTLKGMKTYGYFADVTFQILWISNLFRKKYGFPTFCAIHYNSNGLFQIKKKETKKQNKTTKTKTKTKTKNGLPLLRVLEFQTFSMCHSMEFKIFPISNTLYTYNFRFPREKIMDSRIIPYKT